MGPRCPCCANSRDGKESTSLQITKNAKPNLVTYGSNEQYIFNSATKIERGEVSPALSFRERVDKVTNDAKESV